MDHFLAMSIHPRFLTTFQEMTACFINTATLFCPLCMCSSCFCCCSDLRLFFDPLVVVNGGKKAPGGRKKKQSQKCKEKQARRRCNND